MLEVTTYQSSLEGDTTVVKAKFNTMDVVRDYTVKAIVDRICQAVADRYVLEHYPELVAKLDQNAIANLAIAEASKKIAEEIQRQPNIVHETKREVYQRGLFGGIHRVL